MNKLIAKIQAYVQSQEGATAIEYGLIAGGISLLIVAGVFTFGEELGSVFDSLASSMTDAAANIEEAAEKTKT